MDSMIDKVTKKLDASVELIKELEWSGTTKGPSTAMHLDNGPIVKCCPSCHGIHPDDPWVHCYIKSAVGHKRGCKLAKLLK